ncbi:transketolase [Cutibacterium acnes JCM 18909]|nr:transketolase [Cutibacterium acnes JCM 18909]
MEHTDRPAGLVLSRQDLPTIDRSEYASAEGVAKGAYVVCEASADPKVILIGTGSELSVALEAREKLEADGIPTRVVSMPCQEWFDEQDEEYRESVLPSSVTARVSVEAGIAMGWAKYVAARAPRCPLSTSALRPLGHCCSRSSDSPLTTLRRSLTPCCDTE